MHGQARQGQGEVHHHLLEVVTWQGYGQAQEGVEGPGGGQWRTDAVPYIATGHVTHHNSERCKIQVECGLVTMPVECQDERVHA